MISILDEDCAFCKIIQSGERIFRQTENTATFLSNPSLVKGHALVIPKKHYENLFDIPPEILHELIDETVALQRLLCERLGCQGCDIDQHYTPFLPETRLKVYHVHFHLVPRNFNDELYLKAHAHKNQVFRDLSEKEIVETEDLLS